MSAPVDLIRRVEPLGASLWVNGGRLELDAAADFPDELIHLLRDNKKAVMDALSIVKPTHTAESVESLLTWASELAERQLVLADPVTFVATPLSAVTTRRVSDHAAHYLRVIASARLQQCCLG